MYSISLFLWWLGNGMNYLGGEDLRRKGGVGSWGRVSLLLNSGRLRTLHFYVFQSH